MSTTKVIALMERLSQELGGLMDTTAGLAEAMKALSTTESGPHNRYRFTVKPKAGERSVAEIMFGLEAAMDHGAARRKFADAMREASRAGFAVDGGPSQDLLFGLIKIFMDRGLSCAQFSELMEALRPGEVGASPAPPSSGTPMEFLVDGLIRWAVERGLGRDRVFETLFALDAEPDQRIRDVINQCLPLGKG